MRTPASRPGRLLAGVLALGLPLGGAVLAAAPAAATHAPGHCDRLAAVVVPGAEKQEKACLPDLTTAYTSQNGYTDSSDYGPLNARGTVNPTGVPGIQVDGYFPDTSTSNTTKGWNHDSQFVLRLPDRWNGGLVITGAPGVRKQYANDFIIGDWVLAKGYAYASTDKGNTGQQFQNDGVNPGDAVAEWHQRVTELRIAAGKAVQARYGRAPSRVMMTGISNGGYLTRWQIENRPDLYTAGVDWEGVLWRAEGPNLFTYLPAALKHYPAFRAGNDGARRAIIGNGMPAGSEFMWDYHQGVYWDLTQRLFREEFDPTYDGAVNAGYPFCAAGSVPGCDADYRYADRPAAVKDAVRRISLTGRIGKPMISIDGTLDALLPPRTNSLPYRALVVAAGKGAMHRLYQVEKGNHVDSLVDTYGQQQLVPILPCYRKAFVAMEQWLSLGKVPGPGRTIPAVRPGDRINTCNG